MVNKAGLLCCEQYVIIDDIEEMINMIEKAKHLLNVQSSIIRSLFETAPYDAINLSLGDCQTPISKTVVAAGSQAFIDNSVHYTSNAGLINLREKISALYNGKFTFSVNPDSVIVTSGSIQAIFESLLAHVNPGEEILYPVPGFPPYPNLISFVHGIPIPYRLNPCNGYQLPLDEIEDKISIKTRAIIINSPHNPTGAVLSSENLKSLANLINSHNGKIFVISDEVYDKITYPPFIHHSIAEFCPYTITVSGISKSYGLSGLRIGWAVSQPEVVSNLILIHQNIQSCAPSVSQIIASQIIDQPINFKYFSDLRSLALRELEKLKIPYFIPSGAIYIYLDFNSWGDPYTLQCRFLQNGIIMTPGSEFGDEDYYFRFCFAFNQKTITQAINRLRRVLKSVKRR